MGAVGTTQAELFARLAAQGAMIERLSSDSRRCGPGVAFFAYPGERADGRAHIAEAAARGAAAVLWEEEGFAWRQEWRLPNAAVAGLKQRAGALAHEFYGRPSAALWVCGVTGTNGKTSCSHWIAAALGRRGTRTGVMGTLGSGFPGALSALANTTPDALEAHALLKSLLQQEAAAVAMEVSSHGLVQGRVNGIAFDCALFTNLSHDHLDYHGSMDAYAEAKARLFDAPGLQVAVLNLDDVAGVRLAQRLAARKVKTIGYSLAPLAAPLTGEYLAAEAIEGRSLRIASSWGSVTALVNQLGRFNVSNALGVLGCLLAYGVPLDEGVALLAQLPNVPGRMQREGDRPLVVIDYAHTPDALEKVLKALRPEAQARGGRLVAVFGAGGDRDPAKRPLMGAAAARLADRVLLTSDNPRGEDPLAIIAAIRRGAGPASEVEVDRRRAIEQAVADAAPADVILIAGKGHESTQEIRGRREPFSDEAVARAALAARGAR
ncbi:MAG TPA: UDP-N-acetylmuramoyl-L-alanyl-D-glutamate--2,6-diaminopimelate ligase [Burkholderiales bacterium]